ncbi:hypothetical protein HJG54_17175 [Leptolyngbya sp. NK1-12]|uniref:Uncharacterized protein n=1 Tax=Leptolyngbya sp. NK1-12 TaxID=2547451 RepID=A0AA96WMV2_9CYAN|nr:hypothetical protein [Leptolyngbya sp. NK1-12]WNZ24416.1 hypothetical protein HJG54_17175 [Leptolyngbya sp. NK1-12]
MQQPTLEPEIIEHLNPVAARMMLAALPASIREAFERRAAEIDYPIEAVLEMALASFLDSEALSFSDCKPRY